MLRDESKTDNRVRLIGLAAVIIYSVLSLVLVAWPSPARLTWWPIATMVSAVLLLESKRRQFVLGVGSDSELKMSASPAILFASVLLLPPATLPLLVLLLIRRGSWARAAAGVALDLVDATTALAAAFVVSSLLPAVSPAASVALCSMAAGIMWCVSNAVVVSLLCRAALGIPLRLSPVLRAEAQVPVAVQAGIGLAAASLIEASAWNAPIVAVLVWVNYRYVAAYCATRESQLDVKTGLPLNGEFLRAADREVSRAARSGASLCVLMLDLDHFRQTNTTYGHIAADLVLAEVADRIRGVLRLTDVAARFGGEEFSVLLPGTDGVEAVAVAERIRLAVGSTPVRVSAMDIGVTISIGVAQHAAGECFTDTLERADSALYDAKTSGRNRVGSRLTSTSAT